MDIEACRDYCLSHKGVTEELPFGPDNLVFKVMGKMFALLSLDSFPLIISLKCDPDRAMELREEYDGLITGAYHMSKIHWNSVQAETLPPVLLKELIDHSYELVVKGMTKKLQQQLKDLE